ncbi:hypothetical protein GCM10011495_03030 [Hymenobacter frigidus]|uniref:Uncharacterized protein n=1 Tax=Hymenobacter frigidus TaxID=1524095 RepID=A0ABQ1ZU50_9BACT|nr:hypothetical protein GCM10011495_03030 [Hymenobacter frigidus]
MGYRRGGAGGLSYRSRQHQGGRYFSGLKAGTRYACPGPTLNRHFYIGQINGFQRWLSRD